MEKIKALFDAVIAYCVNEPFHAVIVIGLTVFILAVVTALVVLTIKQSKRKTVLESPSESTENTSHETLLQETVTKEQVDEETSQEEAIKETQTIPAPILDETPEDIEEKEPIEKNTEENDVEADEEAEEIGEEPLQPPEIKTQVRPIKKSEKKKNVAVKSTDGEKNNKTAYKEGTMLHDELKDINTELDFYEEDETDKVARYSGKWVICRVVTNDSENEDMYFFELHASNGKKLLSSEEYTTYNGAIRGIETHKSNILRGNFRISLSKKGDYIFKLLNGKGMLLCMGEHYETKADCEQAIELAKRFARTAFVDENIQDVVVKIPTESDADVTALPEGYNGKWVIDCRVSPEGDKVFFFELLTDTEECLLSSEEYSSYIGAVNGIQTHKVNIKNGNFRVFLTKQGDYIYKLLNGNGQLLCLGEHYRTKRRCENAVELVKRFAMHSPILTDPELTKE